MRLSCYLVERSRIDKFIAGAAFYLLPRFLLSTVDCGVAIIGYTLLPSTVPVSEQSLLSQRLGRADKGTGELLDDLRLLCLIKPGRPPG